MVWLATDAVDPGGDAGKKAAKVDDDFTDHSWVDQAQETVEDEADE